MLTIEHPPPLSLFSGFPLHLSRLPDLHQVRRGILLRSYVGALQSTISQIIPLCRHLSGRHADIYHNLPIRANRAR